MINKISILLFFVAAQLFALGQDKPKKNNFYLGTLPILTSKFDQSQIASNLYLRNNLYQKSIYEFGEVLKENYSHVTIPILAILEFNIPLTFIADVRINRFNYEASKKVVDYGWTDKDGFRSENVNGSGFYFCYGVGKSFRFLENKSLSITPYAGLFTSIIDSKYHAQSKLNGMTNERSFTNYNTVSGAKACIIVNFDVSKRLALGLNLDNIIGIQSNFEKRGEFADQNEYTSLLSPFSDNQFYLALKF
jgi:hypothetical protein